MATNKAELRSAEPLDSLRGVGIVIFKSVFLNWVVFEMNLFEYIKKEWNELKRAPGAFIRLALLCLVAGGAAVRWYDSDKIGDKESELHRYRVALGIDKASQGALVELKNSELALKTRATVAKIRDVLSEWDNKDKVIKDQLSKGQITKEQADKEYDRVRDEVSQEFDRGLSSEAHNVDNELRKRMSPDAMQHIIRVPGFKEGPNGVPVPLTEFLRSTGMDIYYMKGLANEMEQMADLLPKD